MKKRSLITKLALSGVALAATAATLATSTYAWYTSNTSVEAKNVKVSSEATGSSSIFISTDGSKWSQAVSFEDGAFDSTKLVPLQIGTDDGKLYGFNDGHVSSTAASAGYLEFTLYFKTAKTDGAVPLYLESLTLTNKDELTPFDNLLNGASGSDLGISSSEINYTKNIIKSIAYTIETTACDDSFTKLDGKTAYSPLLSWLDGTADSAYATDAHKYYNAVMGEKGALSETDTAERTTEAVANTQIAALSGEGTTATVKFRFYLNGADKDCFDACKNQTFSISLKFNSVGK